MRGLRDLNGDSEDEDDRGEEEVTYLEYGTLKSAQSASRTRRSKRRIRRKGLSNDRVDRLEQRVSMLEGLLQTVAEHQRITVTSESGEWFAHDPETDVTGNGDTRAAAIAQLAEAIAHESGEISFTDEFAADVEEGSRQVAAGETSSADDVRSRLGIDD